MASALTSLGLGSSGVLSYTTIDKLRAADDKAIIAPLDSKLKLNTNQQTSLSILTTATAALKATTSSLSDGISYLKRVATASGTAVSITASSGSQIQDFSIDVTTLAKKDIFQSSSFTNKTDTFTSTNDTLTLDLNGKTYAIDVTAGTSLNDLKTLIFDKTSGAVDASILNVGGDTPYKLILKSANTGFSNAITFTSTGSSAFNLGFNNNNFQADTAATGISTINDTLTFNINGTNYIQSVTSGDTLAQLSSNINANATLNSLLKAKVVNGELILESNDTNMTVTGGASVNDFGLNNLTNTSNHLQSSSDAAFSFNGVGITRSTNSISDLVVGVDITLNEIGSSNISIKQDTSDISTNLKSFVTKYNDLISNINKSIKYDAVTKATGIFQGASQIKSLKTDINTNLFAVNSNGTSLIDYGVTLNSAGILEIDNNIFNSKISTNPSGLEAFFRNTTTIDTTNVSGTPVSTGVITVASGDLIINGTSILTTLSGTPSQNAISLRDAINTAKISGIEASLNTLGTGIALKSTAGYDITIAGNASQLSALGLSAKNTLGTSNTTSGFFSNFNDTLANYIIGKTSILELLNTQLVDKNTSLNEQKVKSTASLDSRYQIMAKKFAAYDSLIGKLNSQFSSLSMMIKQSVSTKN